MCLNISIWETDKNTTCNSKFYGRPKQYTTKWWSNSTLRWLKSWRRDSFPPMMEELLNLDNLSQEEKDKILGVLQKDEMVRQAEDKKIWWVWSKCYVIYMSLIQQFFLSMHSWDWKISSKYQCSEVCLSIQDFLKVVIFWKNQKLKLSLSLIKQPWEGLQQSYLC